MDTSPIGRARRPVARMLERLLGAVGADRRFRSAPPISGLGIVGDRRTAAVVTAAGEVCWFCPGRFDAPGLFGSLLDPRSGGRWRVELPGARPARRSYIGESAILRTALDHPRGELVLVDWMPLGSGGGPRGALCRMLGAAPAELCLVMTPRPDHGRGVPAIRLATERMAVIDERFRLQGSHPLAVRGGAITMRVPRRQESWAVLTDGAADSLIADRAALEGWRSATEAEWAQRAARHPYRGPYEAEARASLRALRLLTFENTGAIVAAATTSLPEIIRGNRNFDYRYSWLRDSGIIVRALVRLEPHGTQARAYLRFVAGLLDTGYQDPLDPVAAVGGERVPPQARLGVPGWRGGRPNLVGNKAARQLQIGSLANFVLAASEVYAFHDDRSSWPTVAATADFLAAEWRRKESGIWEEASPRHHTTSLVLTVCALEAIAPFADDRRSAERWRTAAADVRRFVMRRCRAPDGAFVATPRTRGVDISAALFPVWNFIAADDADMVATMRRLEERNAVGNGLYHRHLLDLKIQREEGAFLAGTFWVAHYRLRAGDVGGCRALVEQGLGYANDLGLFSEEIDVRTRAMIGNIPLGLVHGSLLAVLLDLGDAEGRAGKGLAADRSGSRG